MNHIKLMVGTLALVASVSACGKKSGGGGSDEAPPAKPASGAPMVFEATKVTPGDNFGGALALKAYNFSDKKIAQYVILMRYTDKDGKALKVKPGTPFEKDSDFYSLSGKKYACEPKHWCTLDVDHIDVPAGATKAEVVPGTLTALKDDGMNFEDKPLYDAGKRDGLAEVVVLGRYEDLIEYLAAREVPRRDDPAARTVELPVLAPRLTGSITVRWERQLPYAQVIHAFVLDVPPARTMDIETAITCANELLPVPGLGFHHERRFVYMRRCVPVYAPGVHVRDFQTQLATVLAVAGAVVEPFRRIVDGAPGASIVDLVGKSQLEALV